MASGGGDKKMTEQSRNISDFPTDVRSSFDMPEEVMRRINTEPHISFVLEEGQQVSILIGRRVEPEDPRWTVWMRREGPRSHHYASSIGTRIEDVLKGLGLEIGRKAIAHLTQPQEGAV